MAEGEEMSNVSSDPPAVQSAVSRVFGTFELLEGILVHLPMKDLLFAQRIARAWRAVIARSTPLRRILYLSPLPVTHAWHYQDYETKDSLTSVLLTKVGKGISTNLAHTKSVYNEARLNSLPFRVGPAWSSIKEGYCNCSVCIAASRSIDVYLPETEQLRGKNTAGAMYLTQPPVQTVTLRMGMTKVATISLAERGEGYGNLVISRSGGVTVGNVLSGIRRLKKSGESENWCSIQIHDAIFLEEEEASKDVIRGVYGG